MSNLEDLKKAQQGEIPDVTPTPTSVPTGLPPLNRDFAREDATMKKLSASPSQASLLDPTSLYEMTYTEDELSRLPEYQRLKQLKSGQQKAQEQLLATPAPTPSKLRVLEDALREKTDVGAQSLGVSSLYQDAGISGYGVLLQSLNERGKEMKDRYGSFVNQLEKTAGAMYDTYKTTADRYNLLTKEYDKEVERVDALMSDIMKHEQALELINRRAQVDREAKEWARDNPTIANKLSAEASGLSITPEGGVVTKGSWEDIISKPGSSLVADYTKIYPGSKYNAAGVDFAGAKGSPIRSSTAGTVEFVGSNGGWGNQVAIRDAQGNLHKYSHLNSINNLKKGDTVTVGTLLGGMGNTGNVLKGDGSVPSAAERAAGRGTHLDYTVEKPDGSKYTLQEAARFAGLGIEEEDEDIFKQKKGENMTQHKRRLFNDLINNIGKLKFDTKGYVDKMSKALLIDETEIKETLFGEKDKDGNIKTKGLLTDAVSKMHDELDKELKDIDDVLKIEDRIIELYNTLGGLVNIESIVESLYQRPSMKAKDLRGWGEKSEQKKLIESIKAKL